MAVMDILIQATDRASEVMETVGEKGATAGSWLEENWAKVGATTAIAGAGIEGLARSQSPLTEQTERLARNLNMTSDEMRELARETSDVTFPLDDVLGLMELGTQRGLDSAEALQKYAKNWDLVGDATGLSADMLAEAGVALEHLGITAGQEEEALSAFGYITERTTQDVGEFLNIVERLGPELGELGLDVDQTAGLMGALEHEMGLTGRMARQELQTAIKEADGSFEDLLSNLGLTEEQFKQYTDEVANSSDIIQENADIHADSYTIMEKAQHWASELAYKYGDLIGMASNLAPVLMMVGPLIKGLSVAKAGLAMVTSGSLIPALSGAIASTWAFTTALLANPITWVVVAIVALIGAIVLLWKNWDQVSAFLSDSWDWLKDKAGDFINGLIGWFAELPGRLWEILSNAISRTVEWGDNMISLGVEKASDFLTTVMSFLWELPGRISSALWEALGRVVEWGADLLGRAIEIGSDTVSGFISFYLDLPGRIWEALTDVLGRVASFGSDLLSNMITSATDAVEGFMGIVSDLPSLIWDVLTDVAGNILNIGGRLFENAKNIGSRLWGGFKRGIGKNSPSYLEEAMTDIMEKSDEMKSDLDDDFDYINRFDPDGYTFEPVMAGVGGSGSSGLTEHRHEGVIRVEFEGPGERIREYKDIIIDEIRREVRS